jgi:Uma2 family endonuclease
MVAVEVPRTRHRTGPDESWPDAYVGGAGEQPRRTREEEDALRALEDLFWTLDVGDKYQVELLEGRIEVSARPARWHERVVMWLIRGFDPVCEANGWDPTPSADVPLSPTGDIIEPDYIIARDPSALSDEKSLVPADQVLLVAEVCSPSSLRQDRAVKPTRCASAGIPLYLLIDRFTQPMTITLMSEPWKSGYSRIETVQAGPNGGKLRIPEPFGITIDASTMPEFRGARGEGDG